MACLVSRDELNRHAAPASTWLVQTRTGEWTSRAVPNESLMVFVHPPRDGADVDYLFRLIRDYYGTCGGDLGTLNFGRSDVEVRGVVAEKTLEWIADAGTDIWSRSEMRLENFRSHLTYLIGVALANRRADGLVVGLAHVTLSSSVIDAAAWPLFWVWANGGPTGKAPPRTRVFAIKALQAMIRRRPGLVNGATLSAVEQLQRTVDDWDRLWPTYGQSDIQERAMFVAEANSLVAATATELAQQGLDVSELHPVVAPPPGPAVPWIPVLGAGAAALGALAVAVSVRDRRAGGRRRR